ncbi:anti-sigma factor [Paenibacillus sp. NEAU-GSW1]|uniref:anti-sigma factor family protein n=1 Tax=Paenibacillus sp. NEAU-GSW1 TaxID=2682486 RepID=UPI0012E18230|nr:zf-HC2 domain-containing protein [Paenibacillus sp. NEAU-GSW1]MUT67905.1 hypothetical protein [Paenibacillus sp. NEAU-GSW1]
MNDYQENLDKRKDGEPLHIDESLMKLYVDDVLPEAGREQVESHMAECDICLERFMVAMSAAEAEPAESEIGSEVVQTGVVAAANNSLPDMEKLGQRLVRLLYPNKQTFVQEKPYRRRTWLQHPSVHFGAAAAITLLLLGTGTFNGVADRVNAFDEQAETERQVKAEGKPSYLDQSTGKEQTQTWSDRMVDRTVSWFDGIEKSRFK